MVAITCSKVIVDHTESGMKLSKMLALIKISKLIECWPLELIRVTWFTPRTAFAGESVHWRASYQQRPPAPNDGVVDSSESVNGCHFNSPLLRLPIIPLPSYFLFSSICENRGNCVRRSDKSTNWNIIVL